jgi:hypothetical protein
MSIIIIDLCLKEIAFFVLILILPIFLIANAITSQEKLSLLMAQAQLGQDNASATDMENLRNTIIPQAEEVNEANSQLIFVLILQMLAAMIQ